jgi:hypothetical protein
MTWTPKLDLLPARPFAENLKVALQTFLPDALAWAAGQCGLADPPPTPLEIHFSRAQRAKYPVVNILVPGSDPEWVADGGQEENKHLLVEYETLASDDELLKQVLEASILAIRSIALEMGEPDWWGPIDSTNRGDMEVSVERERYGERSYDSEKTFLQVGSVVVTITYTEPLGEGD